MQSGVGFAPSLTLSDKAIDQDKMQSSFSLRGGAGAPAVSLARHCRIRDIPQSRCMGALSRYTSPLACVDDAPPESSTRI